MLVASDKWKVPHILEIWTKAPRPEAHRSRKTNIARARDATGHWADLARTGSWTKKHTQPALPTVPECQTVPSGQQLAFRIDGKHRGDSCSQDLGVRQFSKPVLEFRAFIVLSPYEFGASSYRYVISWRLQPRQLNLSAPGLPPGTPISQNSLASQPYALDGPVSR